MMTDKNSNNIGTVKPFEFLVFSFGCLLTAYTYNPSSVPIQIGFGLSFLFTLSTIVYALIQCLSKHEKSSIKSYLNSKIIGASSILVLTGIFSYWAIHDYHEIISYILFGISEIALILEVLRFR